MLGTAPQIGDQRVRKPCSCLPGNVGDNELEGAGAYLGPRTEIDGGIKKCTKTH